MKKSSKRLANPSAGMGLLNQQAYRQALQDARNSGLRFKKIWIGTINYVAGKPYYCHMEYEKLGYVEMDYEYAPGLKFPGDPECNDREYKEECPCTLGFKVIE